MNHSKPNGYNIIKPVIFVILLTTGYVTASETSTVNTDYAEITYHRNGEHEFSDEHIALINRLTDKTIIKVKKLMPALASNIKLNIKLMVTYLDSH